MELEIDFMLAAFDFLVFKCFDSGGDARRTLVINIEFLTLRSRLKSWNSVSQ